MIVGIDIDEVVCGLWFKINKFLIEKHDLYLNYEEDLVDYHIERLICVPKCICNEIVDNINNGSFMQGALPMPYAEHAINKLRIAGFKILLITNRDKKFKKITEEWLAKHNIYYDGLYLTPSKSDVVMQEKVEAMIDDRHDVLSKIAKYNHPICPLKYGMYCIDVPWSKRYYNPNITKVQHVAEAVDRIVALKGKI